MSVQFESNTSSPVHPLSEDEADDTQFRLELGPIEKNLSIGDGGLRRVARRDRAAFAKLLRNYICYDFMPASGKIVVLDTRLPVKAALQAMVENGI